MASGGQSDRQPGIVQSIAGKNLRSEASAQAFRAPQPLRSRQIIASGQPAALLDEILLRKACFRRAGSDGAKRGKSQSKPLKVR